MKLHLAAAVAAAAITPALIAPAVAPAHHSRCHGAHSCPSDHATYKWRGKLCVKPSSDKRTSAFRKKIRLCRADVLLQVVAPRLPLTACALTGSAVRARVLCSN